MSRHHRRVPSKIGDVVGALADDVQPQSLLADVQRVWPEVAGPQFAKVAEPTAAARGVVTIACADALWAEELRMSEPALVDAFAARLGAGVVHKLRVQSVPSVGWLKK